MNLPDSARLLASIASFALSAATLWSAAQLFVAARARAQRSGRLLRLAALGLASAALWWPGHFLTVGTEGTFAGIPLVAGFLSVAFAAVAGATATLATRRTLPAFAGLAVVTVMLAYAHAVFATPGLFRAAAGAGAWGPSVAVLALPAALVALGLDFQPGRQAVALRLGLAAVAAGLLTAAAAHPVDAGAALVTPWTEALLMAAVLALALVLHASLDAAPQFGAAEHPLPRRAHTAVPTVDNLTQLPTRVYFEDRLAAAATKADSGAGKLALLFIDLDGFKPVNDTYGHSIGDRVLEQVGQRLKATSRGKDVVARIGGDEFLLLLTNVHEADSVAAVASRLIEGLSQPYTVEGRDVMISCSVGIAMYPDGCAHQKLIARADAAMYASKRAGGSNHCFYSPAMDADAEAQFVLLRDLRKAIASQEFELHYQPKIDSKSGKVTAVEALLRWRHPTRGMLLPNEFIPLSERFGLIGPLGNWVIEEACRQSRQWREKGLRMRVAINLSAHQMRQDDIVERITGALHTHKIHPSLLTCEITETAAMEDTKTTQTTFRRLGELGTHLSIDDFGTGYSSLAYLRKLPAEELKIDRSFIMDLEHSADARAVVDAVIKLAHALGLKVVAEGVENQRQQQVLVGMGCDELQGFLFARPMSSRALLIWAMNDRAESAVFRPSLFDETRQSEHA